MPFGQLSSVFARQWRESVSGDLHTRHWSIERVYLRTGTFHLFPRRKDLIERINRVVGQARQWLPHDPNAVPESFWQQYHQAEKAAARMPNLPQLIWRAERNWSDLEKDRARQELEQAHLNALAELGINYSRASLLKHEQTQRVLRSQLPLLPAHVA